MSPFITEPNRVHGIRFTEKFTTEMLGHLYTCARNDEAAGFDPRTVAMVTANLEALLRTSGMVPHAFIPRLSYDATLLPGGEVERWAKYIGGLLIPAIHPTRERRFLPENWGLSAQQLHEKLRGNRRRR